MRKAYYGEYKHDEHEIWLSSDKEKHPNQDALYDTLYHEMGHASLAVSGLSHLLTEELEEALVRMFDNILIPAILLAHHYHLTHPEK